MESMRKQFVHQIQVDIIVKQKDLFKLEKPRHRINKHLGSGARNRHECLWVWECASLPEIIQLSKCFPPETYKQKPWLVLKY